MSTPPSSAAAAARGPYLLTAQQGDAARRLLDYVLSLPLSDPDAQLLATVIVIRAARGGTGDIIGQDLHSLHLMDPDAAVAALVTLGWKPAGDLLTGDPLAPVPVTVPGVVGALPMGATPRYRVSGWISRTMASKAVKRSSSAVRLTALLLAAHGSADEQRPLPAQLPDHCRIALPELLAKGFLADLSNGNFLLAETVAHLAGARPAPTTSAGKADHDIEFDRQKWQAWKQHASPALRQHAEAVEQCPQCALATDRVVAAFMQPSVPLPFARRVTADYAAWKTRQGDRGPRAAQFVADFRVGHGHGPSLKQLCDGLGWKAYRELRAFIVSRLIVNEWLTNTTPVPWTLRPGPAAGRPPAPSAVPTEQHGVPTR